MRYLQALTRPAVIIIGLIVLINAGMFFYFDAKSEKSDKAIAAQAEDAEELAKQNARILTEFEQERNIRADQACNLFETDHLKDVQELKQTYKFLLDPDAVTENKALVKFIVLNLPRTEEEARLDSAPPYCDGTFPNGDDIGLPEPDPKIPERPKALDQLTKQITPQS